MDYQKAIKEAEIQIDMYEGMILYNKDFEPRNDNSNYERKMDFLKTAISAMQELQAIHNNGISLERLKDIDFRKQVVEHINYMEYLDIKDVLEEYKRLGTLEEVREAVEKQKEERPIAVLGTFGGEEHECRECGNTVEYMDEYCKWCGKKLDWSEEDEQ